MKISKATYVFGLSVQLLLIFVTALHFSQKLAHCLGTPVSLPYLLRFMELPLVAAAVFLAGGLLVHLKWIRGVLISIAVLNSAILLIGVVAYYSDQSCLIVGQ